MKRTVFFILAALFLFPSSDLMAQKKGKREVSPVIEGRQKVRETDYDSVWKFSTFDAKSKYFCPFDYTTMSEVTDHNNPEWGSMTPVMNYLTTVSRSPVRLCAVFAINPAVDDDQQKAQLVAQARQEALSAYEAFHTWAVKKKMRNKMQFNVAQVDYRYWKGAQALAANPPVGDIIPLGYILYFGSKKMDLFPKAAADAKTFNDVKFFPNDATITDSYVSYLDELADYLKQNDRLEVLLSGYSDNSGTESYNIGLSRQRAVEIKKELVKRGVQDYRIEMEALGSANPIGDNNTRLGRIANNRVSVTIQ